MTDRLTELETQFAFQDDTISELNRIVTDQQEQIDRLREQVEQLHERLMSLAQTVAEPQENEPPPPHY